MQQTAAIQVHTNGKAKLNSIRQEAASERAFAINACTVILSMILIAWFITG